MKPHWERQYSQLLIEFNQCKALKLPETELAEVGFRIASEYWEQLKVNFLNCGVYTDVEEIEFFKMVKPQFTCHIEYYLVLNQGLLFIPIDPAERINYWQEELRRHQRFFDRNTTFIKYWEGKRKDHDPDYFLRRNNRSGFLPQEKIYNDMDCRSSHDHLIRSLLANQMYHEYVKNKLEEVKGIKVTGDGK